MLWYFWHLPSWLALAVLGITLAAGIGLFPYLTKFDLTGDTKTSREIRIDRATSE
jgi:hypothetical protein